MKNTTEYQKDYRESHRKELKKYQSEKYQQNKVKRLARRKKYAYDHKEEIAAKTKLWREKNPNKIKEWRQANVEHIRAYKKKYKQEHKTHRNTMKRERTATDILYKLTNGIRRTISTTLSKKGYTKKSRTYQILGCSFDELKLHMESLFQPWMNWGNYGNWNGIPMQIGIAWDIDHIILIHTAKTEEDIIKLNHFTNLQPLDSYINRNIKSGKL